MADYGAYANPEILFNPQNAQLAANTVAAWRDNLSKNLETFTQIKQAQHNRIVQRNERKRAQLDKASLSFNDEYLKAKTQADKFTSALRGTGKTEALNMSNQIQQTLYKVGEELNRKITEAGPDVSQFQIDRLTADAIAEVTRLKNDMTNLYAAYQEYEEAKDLDPSDPRALLPNSNPEMQELFAKLDDGKDNVILSQDPSNGHWILIPIDDRQDGDYTELIDGTKTIKYDKDIGIIDASDYSIQSGKEGGYFEFVGGPNKQGNYLNDAKTLAQDLVDLAKQEEFSTFRRDVAENAPATKDDGLLSSDIRHITEYDHEAMKAWLLENPSYLNTFLPESLDGALQQITNTYITDLTDISDMNYENKLQYYYDKLIDDALLRLPKSE